MTSSPDPPPPNGPMCVRGGNGLAGGHLAPAAGERWYQQVRLGERSATVAGGSPQVAGIRQKQSREREKWREFEIAIPGSFL